MGAVADCLLSCTLALVLNLVGSRSMLLLLVRCCNESMLVLRERYSDSPTSCFFEFVVLST